MDDHVGRRSPRSLSPERRASTLPQSDHTRDPAGEEFLFHLFRGSELLQDSRVHEAKEELEQALMLQPRDPKGQDLLAVVYFRIGHYPRAIQIYEQLKHDHPGRASLSLNLALCYLKTGQAQLAREELEEVVRLSPDHRRAWGYLGLAYERLGDYDKAELSFERGGHAAMVRRMMQRRGGQPSIVSISSELGAYSVHPSDAARDEAVGNGAGSVQESAGEGQSETAPEAAPYQELGQELGQSGHERVHPDSDGLAGPLADLRAAAAEAFEELDSGELSFSLAQADTRRPDGEMWHAVEIGEAVRLPEQSARSAPNSVPATSSPLTLALAPRLRSALAPTRLSVPPKRPVSTGPGGQIVVSLAGPSPHASAGAREHVEGPRAFAVRFDALRSYTGTLSAAVLERRGRHANDSFGGISGTVMQVSGDGMLVLAPRPGRSALTSMLGEEEVLFLREDAVLAFDLAMTFENGSLPRGDDEPIFVAQMRGPGPLAFEFIEPLSTLEVTPARAATVRSPSILGWMGRLVPDAIPPGKAPGGQRGLISFVGAGTVLVAGR